MKKENEATEINLKHLLLYVLRRWRKIVCVGLVFAFILGLYQGINYIGNWNNNKKIYEKEQKAYTKELNDYKYKKEYYTSQINGYRQDIEDQKEYLANSVLMNLDYKNVAQVNANVFFKLDEAALDRYDGVAYDPTDSLLALFYNKIYYNIDWKTIAQKYNTEPRYIEELVDYETQKDANILNVSVSHSKADVAAEILDEFVKVISIQAQTFEKDTFEYTISITKSEVKYANDTELLKLQRDAEASIISTNEKLAEAKSNKEALVKPVMSVSAPSYITLIKNVIIFAVVGMILGVIALVIIYAIVFCLGGRVHSQEEISDRYGVRVLGTVSTESKKRFGAKIDNLIETFGGMNFGMTAEQKEKLLVHNIKDTINSAKKLLLIGAASQEDLTAVKDLISSTDKNINITVENSILNNVDAYDKIAENDVIISVEKIGSSRYADIYATEDLIKSKGKDIAGYVLV